MQLWFEIWAAVGRIGASLPPSFQVSTVVVGYVVRNECNLVFDVSILKFANLNSQHCSSTVGLQTLASYSSWSQLTLLWLRLLLNIQ